MARSDLSSGPDGINHYIPHDGGNAGTPQDSAVNRQQIEPELDDLERRVEKLERAQREKNIP